jgi:hypothetical protein
MKNLTSKMVAVAALVAAAGIASAQTMEATIPFAFHANGKAFPAGNYSVRVRSSNGGYEMLNLLNKTTHGVAIAPVYYVDNAKGAWKDAGSPVLSFQCAGGDCVLKDLWTGSGELVYRLPTPKPQKGEAITTAEVVMHQVKAD